MLYYAHVTEEDMPAVPWASLMLDHRADVIQDSHVYLVKDPTDPGARIVDLRANAGVERQIHLLMGSSCEFYDVPADLRGRFTHRVYFPHGFDNDFIELMKVLKKARTLLSPSYTDFALVLDWYKVPNNETDSMSWANTEAGELVSRSKYWKTPSVARTAARKALIGQVGDLISDHPLLRDAEFIVAAPGHNADGHSFGEQFADQVAAYTDKNRVPATSTTGPWEARKEGGSHLNIETAFEVEHELYGTVIVLDDVIRRGQTMSATACAARNAGAEIIAGVAAVKTLRS